MCTCVLSCHVPDIRHRQGYKCREISNWTQKSYLLVGKQKWNLKNKNQNEFIRLYLEVESNEFINDPENQYDDNDETFAIKGGEYPERRMEVVGRPCLSQTPPCPLTNVLQMHVCVHSTMYKSIFQYWTICFSW